MQSAISRLPSELWDLIIDSFQYDRRSLLACNLASRSWLPRTRFYLFHNVSIADELDYLEFESIIEASPEIVGLVRKLEWYPDSLDLPTCYWLHRELFRILKVLDKVEHLSISHWRAPELSEDMKQDLSTVPVFPMVTTLRFYKVELPLKDDLVKILRACPRLHELEFHECERSTSRAPRDILLSETPSALVPGTAMTVINTLRLVDSDLYIVECLFQCPFTLNLQRLHFSHSYPWIDSTALALRAIYTQRLTRGAGASLEELSIDLTPHLPPPEGYVDLSHNSSLVSLRLLNIGVSRGEVYEERWGAFPRILASVRSPHLKEIYIGLSMRFESHKEDLNILDWEEVDELLAHLVHDQPELTVTIALVEMDPGDSEDFTFEECLEMEETVRILLTRMEAEIRFILFHNARIASEQEYLEFESIVEASPEIAGLVRKLEWFPPGKSPKYDWLHRELFRILKVFDKVEELHISSWRAPGLCYAPPWMVRSLRMVGTWGREQPAFSAFSAFS
ncbi:hypothetical protein B0H21DRAFT_889433 [Amylocystis lapponica]|nr:hypothetical protein B0H21DRAFT_889433 [Amylocystis lapponica]